MQAGKAEHCKMQSRPLRDSLGDRDTDFQAVMVFLRRKDRFIIGRTDLQ